MRLAPALLSALALAPLAALAFPIGVPLASPAGPGQLMFDSLFEAAGVEAGDQCPELFVRCFKDEDLAKSVGDVSSAPCPPCGLRQGGRP